ncbi:pancreatic triacylglycerol lipase-like, partial [Aphidius gifuensis]
SYKNVKIDCSRVSGIADGILSWFSYLQKSTSSSLKVFIKLYTRNNSLSHILINPDDNINLNLSYFNIERKSVFIIHGFMTPATESWMDHMKNAYLEYEDVNVFVIDWTEHSFVWNYYKAIENSLEVGKIVSNLIAKITRYYLTINNNKTWGKIHLIGHSLGAHICGIIADDIKMSNGKWTVTRITGLDPAQPCFVGSNLTLNKYDAPFVDVIHTNGRQIIPGIALGAVDDIGTIDFYVNGGYFQPSCNKTPIMLFKMLKTIIDLSREAFCSHMIAIDYFTESIKIASVKSKQKFWSFKWDGTYKTAENIIGNDCSDNDCIVMGIEADKYSIQGKFFVSTAMSYPYHGPIVTNDINEILNQLEVDIKH